MLAGEYAVLAGSPAIVCAVNKYLTCEVRPSERWGIAGNGERWHEGDGEVPKLSFPVESLRVVRDYLEGHGKTLPAVELTLSDDLRAPSGAKLGLGGSACSSVGVIAGVLAAAQWPFDKELIYKLAAVAHGKAQARPGSAVDVAAATFGGVVWTFRFDVGPLVAAWRAGPAGFAEQVDRAKTPFREQLRPPEGIVLAFSGESASTAALVGEIERFASVDPSAWKELVTRTGEACERLRDALQAGNEAGISGAIRSAGRWLEELSERSRARLVTEAHRRVAAEAERLGVAAKISGAGGGDCCVALGRLEALGVLARRLQEEGMLAVPIEVDPHGVRAQ